MSTLRAGIMNNYYKFMGSVPLIGTGKTATAAAAASPEAVGTVFLGLQVILWTLRHISKYVNELNFLTGLQLSSMPLNHTPCQNM